VQFVLRAAGEWPHRRWWCDKLLDRMKDLFVSDLSSMDESKPLDGYFLLLSHQQRTTRSGKAYLSLILGDKTGQIEGRVWEPGDPRISDVTRGDLVKVRGNVSRFEDRLQMKVDQIRKATSSEADHADMLPSTTYDVDGLWQQLLSYADSLTDPHLHELIRTILDDTEIVAKFREAPAAKQLHHAWLGGLLEHVVSLLGLADRVVPHYPLLNRDLIITGVILHDIGKTRELEWATGFEYTVEGTLLGHIQFGAALAEKTMERLPDFPPRLKTLVLHMILAHHGKLEFGSPKLPMIPEALVLNFLDDLDAKMATVAMEFDKAMQQGKKPGEFTDRVWALDQRQLLNSKRWLDEGESIVTAAANRNKTL